MPLPYQNPHNQKCCICKEELLDSEILYGYCEDCRDGGGDLEDILDVTLNDD